MSEGGAGMRELRRLDSIVSPQARQQAAKAQTDQESNTTKFQALLKYLDLSSEEWVRCCCAKAGKLEEWPGWTKGKPKSHKPFKVIPTDDSEEAVQQKRKADILASKARARWEEELNNRRRQLKTVEPAELNELMRRVFDAYCDRPYLMASGEHKMSVTGWMRLLHDTLLLDNAITPCIADAVFTGVPLTGDVSTIPKDQRLDFDAFKSRLRDMAWQRTQLEASVTPGRRRANGTSDGGSLSRKSTDGQCRKSTEAMPQRKSNGGREGTTNSVDGPDQTPADMAYLALIRKWVLPLANQGGTEEGSALDGLYCRPSLDALRHTDGQLRRLFSWYSTLDDPRVLPWERVVEYGVTITADDTVLMLLNFEVVPSFLSRLEAASLFAQHVSPAPDGWGVGLRGTSSGDFAEKYQGRHYTAFLETMALMAGVMVDALPERMQANATPEELRSFRRYMKGCDPVLRTKLEQALAVVSVMRRVNLDDEGLQASGLDFFAYQGQRGREAQAAAANQEDLGKKLDVLARREETRAKLALTRLRNYYADVRSAAEIMASSWPAAAHNTSRTGHTTSCKDGDEGEVEVAFFAGPMQIKTPKLPPARSRGPSLVLPGNGALPPYGLSPHGPGNGTAQSVPWRLPGGSQGRDGAGGGGVPGSKGQRASAFMPGTAMSSMTLQQQLQMLGAGLQGLHSAGGHHTGGGSNGHWVYGGRHHVDRVQIEARDAHDVMREFTRTLPTVSSPPLHAQRRSRSAGGGPMPEPLGTTLVLPIGAMAALPEVLSSHTTGAGVLLTYHPHHNQAGTLPDQPSVPECASPLPSNHHTTFTQSAEPSHHHHYEIDSEPSHPQGVHHTRGSDLGYGASAGAAREPHLVPLQPSETLSAGLGPNAEGSGLTSPGLPGVWRSGGAHRGGNMGLVVVRASREQNIRGAAAVLGAAGAGGGGGGGGGGAGGVVLPPIHTRTPSPKHSSSRSRTRNSLRSPGSAVSMSMPVMSQGLGSSWMPMADPAVRELHQLDEFDMKVGGGMGAGAGGVAPVLVNQPWRSGQEGAHHNSRLGVRTSA